MSRGQGEDVKDLETGKRAQIGTKYQEREFVSPTTYGNSPVGIPSSFLLYLL